MQSLARTTLLIAILGIAAGCDDSTGTDFDAVLLTDTVEVAAPLPQNEGRPTAIDITPAAPVGVIGGRFPERSRDATEWDFVVRLRDGQLVLVPGTVVGLSNTRAAITPAIEGSTFDTLREAPGQSLFDPETVVALEVGRVYGVRSRPAQCGGFTGEFYGKLEPLEIDTANGRLRFRIIVNRICGDPRLADDE